MFIFYIIKIMLFVFILSIYVFALYYFINNYLILIKHFLTRNQCFLISFQARTSSILTCFTVYNNLTAHASVKLSWSQPLDQWTERQHTCMLPPMSMEPCAATKNALHQYGSDTSSYPGPYPTAACPEFYVGQARSRTFHLTYLCPGIYSTSQEIRKNSISRPPEGYATSHRPKLNPIPVKSHSS